MAGSGYTRLLWFGNVVVNSWSIHSVAINHSVDIGRNGVTHFLGEMTEQARRSCEQSDPTQQLRRQSEVSQGRTSYASAIERQRAAKHLSVNPANSLEQT